MPSYNCCLWLHGSAEPFCVSFCPLLPPLSPSSAVVLNHISSHFLILLSDSSFICTAVTRHFGHYNRYYIYNIKH